MSTGSNDIPDPTSPPPLLRNDLALGGPEANALVSLAAAVLDLGDGAPLEEVYPVADLAVALSALVEREGRCVLAACLSSLAAVLRMGLLAGRQHHDLIRDHVDLIGAVCGGEWVGSTSEHGVSSRPLEPSTVVPTGVDLAGELLWLATQVWTLGRKIDAWRYDRDLDALAISRLGVVEVIGAALWAISRLVERRLKDPETLALMLRAGPESSQALH